MKQLSKSKYAKFCQCPKCLWLSEYKPLQEVTSGTGNIIADIAKREGSPISTNEGSPIGSPISSPNTADAIIAMIKENPYISTSMMAGKLGISKRAVIKHTNQLQLDGKIKRNGSARSGSWEIIC